MNTLLGYRRKSVVRDATDLVSPEQQAHACEAWRGIHLPQTSIEWYEDIDRSARDEKGRPGWLSLIAQLERPGVMGVIAYSFDRLYRNVYQFLDFLNRLESLRLRLIVVRESLDTSTSMGRAIVTILMAIAQLESDQTSERMVAAVKYRREVQGRHWGPTPWGCDRDEQGQLIPSQRGYWLNPKTGEALREAEDYAGLEFRYYYDALQAEYALYVSNPHTYDSLTAALNDTGWRFPDRYGNPRLLDRDDVRRSLAYWRLFRGDLPTGKIQRKKGVILEGGHPPILPVELCNQVGDTLVNRGRIYNRRQGVTRIYLLSNVLYCGVCGQRMRGVKDHGLNVYRHAGAKGSCPERWVSAVEAEREVIDSLSHLNDPDLIGYVRALHRQELEQHLNRPDNLQLLNSLTGQREKLARLEDLYLDGEIDKERYKLRKVEILQKINELEAQIYTDEPAMNLDETIDRLLETLGKIAEGEPETQKVLINSTFERIEIIGGKVGKYVPRAWAKAFFDVSSKVGQRPTRPTVRTNPVLSPLFALL